MKWLKANGQNPQGAGGTDWTLIGSEGDGVVSDESATSMQANHKVVYPACCGHGTSSSDYANYGHSDYVDDDSTSRNVIVDFQDGGGWWYRIKDGPHAVQWGYYASSHVTW